MTRKEEMQNKLLELIEHVKDVPKKEALAAVGLDMAEWADKTMIDKACDAYCKVCGHYPHKVPTHICRQDCEYYDDFRKAMED